MTLLRTALALGVASLGLAAASPAAAQFYLSSKDYSGDPVRGDEPGLGTTLPGATDAELNALVIWNTRAALNVAALSCDFEPTLLTVENYNAILKDHNAELMNAFETLNKYFIRTAKSKPAGQKALDQFGTRTYSGFATVSGKYSFCQTASAVGRDAIFAPRGSFGTLARTRLRELRNALVPYGEQRFLTLRRMPLDTAALPPLADKCWDKKGFYVTKKCGPINWPAAAQPTTAIAAN